MSAFEVYLVMQADRINSFLEFVAFLFIGIACASLILIARESSVDIDEEMNKKLFKVSKRSLIFGISTLIYSVLMPSSSTIAAMYVLPQFTSPEVLEPAGKEAKEIYSLAKKALKKLVESDEQGN